MTKEQSLQIKGVAILMMLYVHLFHSSESVELCTYWLHYGSTPLFQKFTRCTVPVPFFLIVSGYGFMMSVLGGSSSHKSFLQRGLSLYVPYWLITGTMCAIALWLLGGAEYDFSAKPIFYNVTALYTTYNSHCWFILPYLLLVAFSRSICRLVQRGRAVYVVLIGLVCHVASYDALGRFDAFLHSCLLALLVVNCAYLLFPFLLGSLLAKYTYSVPGVLRKAWVGRHPHTCCALLLLLTVFAKLHFPGIVNPVYAIVFVFLFAKLPSVPVVSHVLMVLGRYSLGMWMVHHWLLDVFFYDTLFSLRYPVVIFVALVLASLASAYVFDQLQERMVRRFLRV